MRNKNKIFELNDELFYKVNKYYFDLEFKYCEHKHIAVDKRDYIFKCTTAGCWQQYWFTSKRQYKKFRFKIIKEFDFLESELNFKKSLAKK